MDLSLSEDTCPGEREKVFIVTLVLISYLGIPIWDTILGLSLKIDLDLVWHFTHSFTVKGVYNFYLLRLISVFCYLYTGKVFDLHALRDERMINPMLIEKFMLIRQLVTFRTDDFLL